MASSQALRELSFLSTVMWFLLLGAALLGSVRVSADNAEDRNQCDVCLEYTFLPPPAALAYPPNTQFFHGLNDDICYDVWRNLSSLGDLVIRSADLQAGFGDGGRGCGPDDMFHCATLTSPSVARRYKAAIISGAKKVVTEILCPSLRNAYGFNVRTKEPDFPDDNPNCFPMNVNVACRPAPVPFPKARCIKTPGTTRLAVTANLTGQAPPGRINGTNLYCFNVTAVQPNASVPSNCSSTKLSRAEIWADDSKRAFVTGLRVTRNGGTPVWGPPAWGAVRDNALKVGAPLLSNWTLTEAIGGQICVEISDQIKLQDLCIGDAVGHPVDDALLSVGACYLSLFNDKDACCPTYGIELPNEHWSTPPPGED